MTWRQETWCRQNLDDPSRPDIASPSFQQQWSISSNTTKKSELFVIRLLVKKDVVQLKWFFIHGNNFIISKINNLRDELFVQVMYRRLLNEARFMAYVVLWIMMLHVNIVKGWGSGMSLMIGMVRAPFF